MVNYFVVLPFLFLTVFVPLACINEPVEMEKNAQPITETQPTTETDPATEGQKKVTPSRRSLANPAAVKCVEDGYELVPLFEDGIQIGHQCRNPETGEMCEVWRYFRGECSLVFE